MENERGNGPVDAAIREGKREGVRGRAGQPVCPAGGEVPPLEVYGDDRSRPAFLREPPAEVTGDRPGAGADVHDHRPCSRSDLRGEPAGECARGSPGALHALQVPERARHLLGRERVVVEDLVRGLSGRDEEVTTPRLTTSALFFDPKPMQLQSACSNDAARDRPGDVVEVARAGPDARG